MNAAEDIRKFLKGEVEDDAASLEVASHDASIFEIRPALVAHPKDVEDVQALVRYASAHAKEGVSLTPRSAGTDMTGGALTESVVVEFTRHFNAIKEVGDGFAVTQPGVFYRDFEKETLKHGLFLPCYPASREICTVGGMAANDSGGEKSLHYGKAENFVEKLKVVLRDGEEHEFRALDAGELDAKLKEESVEGDIYRRISKLIDDNETLLQKAKPKVSKNSAGYYLWNVRDKAKGTFDLTKLLVGSQGTLGLITEITWRLVKPATHEKLLVIFLKDLKKLPGVVNAVMAHDPESFESYDDHTFKLAVRYFRDIMKFLAAKSLFGLAWQFLPEVKMILRHGFPKQVMLAEFTGMSEAEVDGKIDAAMKDLASFGVGMRKTVSMEDANKYWVMRRESFNLLRRHFKKFKAAPFIDDFCVPPKDLPEFLPRLYDILDPYDLTLTLVGHVGDGNFHIIPLMDLSDPKTKTIIEELSRKVYALVFEYGGTTTGEHNDGLIRGSFLKQMYGEEVCALFAETKKIFDPDGIFNPGKKTGADLGYALAHMKKG